ncbi:hypothetical protein FHQ26_06650 [Testudinibacter sp. TR-2022]|uniref:hypothetical protein n=1 Tax=Testudinibacter sp. TR-2022 TaxID=2585029 RepID=UPI001119CF99|nr:hypothetical protein [Testudinibacter sp. TR-2022]TNH00304.1 hypothetical protein FHQ22_12180 [Pasteurellaceae bacterium Phil31]TNH09728.1 hypothetical protein FHQ26_06650 [Testudinibacter sp. TR-2022]TNH11109.1 hypothetical protein FHQ25_03620 [Testudinibacter sp. TR-2022]TNH13397.1 hypothetical protein FIA56_07580 [Testudinibacter sp. TR-2022]TNH19497.1 hypothetical protein FHQ23_02710 [Testudinibacter sp. TR-2022]
MYLIKNSKTILGALVLSASIVLTGCQNDGLGSSSNVDSRLTQGQQAKFFSESGRSSCGMGALGGALLGGLVGALSGDSEDAVAGAAIGAVAGCGVLMGANYYLEDQRAKYSNKEQRINATINDVKNDTAQVQAVTNSAKIVLAQNKQTLNNLQKQLNNNTIQKAQAQQQLAQVDGNIKYLYDKLSKMKQKESAWRDVAKQEKQSGANVQKLNAQIAQLNKQINLLENQVREVSKQRTAIRLG